MRKNIIICVISFVILIGLLVASIIFIGMLSSRLRYAYNNIIVLYFYLLISLFLAIAMISYFNIELWRTKTKTPAEFAEQKRRRQEVKKAKLQEKIDKLEKDS